MPGVGDQQTSLKFARPVCKPHVRKFARLLERVVTNPNCASRMRWYEGFTSNDGHEFTMEKSAAMLSGLVKQMVQIVKWCEKHKTMPEWEEEKWWLNSRDSAMTKWEDDFMADVDELLFELFCAANYMDIKCLTDKCADTVALMVRAKTWREIRKIWMLENDFTPEEEEEMK
ncbi:unnamed protein product, partial [Mesorhabditis spiculigera]